MSQPYGQQPGDYNQGQQPGYGAMPPAPPEYTGGPIPRPGAVSDAESIGGVDVDEGMLAVLWILAIVGLAGGGLLIWGGAKALSGTAGQLLVIAAALQIVLCIIWLAGFNGGIVS